MANTRKERKRCDGNEVEAQSVKRRTSDNFPARPRELSRDDGGRESLVKEREKEIRRGGKKQRKKEKKGLREGKKRKGENGRRGVKKFKLAITFTSDDEFKRGERIALSEERENGSLRGEREKLSRARGREREKIVLSSEGRRQERGREQQERERENSKRQREGE